jgi:hypothetical protein
VAKIPNTGLTLVKEFTYRDLPEQWTNHYWLSGTVPTADAEWKTLADSLIAHEKTCYSARSSVVAAYGYNESETDPLEKPPHAVWGYDYAGASQSVPGTLTSATGHFFAGDQAGFVWWKTARRSSSGKPIYLRKYFHDGFESLTDVDDLATEVDAAYTQLANDLVANLPSLGLRNLQSHLGTEALVSWGHGGWVTTRTLKRRGKRPRPT